MTEAVWQRSQYVPTIEEYMKNAVPSYLMGPILFPTLYFLRENLKATVVKDHEYNELYRLMSTCGRLLNDSQSFEVFADFTTKYVNIPKRFLHS